MKKLKVIIILLIIVLLCGGIFSYWKFHKGKSEKSVSFYSDVDEETIEGYGVDQVVYSDPEDVISAIENDYLSVGDTVSLEKTDGDCWYYVDSNSHHYMYCQSQPVITIIP